MNPRDIALLLGLAAGCRSSGPDAVPAKADRPDGPEMAAIAASPSTSLMIHFIDIGQGNCTLAVCPGGYTILVDCGSTSGADADEIRNYILGELGASPRVDALVITHPDKDHNNLLPEVLAGVTIGHIYMVGPPGEHDEDGVDAWLASFRASRRAELRRRWPRCS